MKLLTFLAQHFWWKSYSKTLEEALEVDVEDRAENAVVVFLHAESKDQGDEEHSRVVRHCLKHVKWLANKRELKNVVLHSFTHLGADNAEPAVAANLMAEIGRRLTENGYRVKTTPFGYFCEWELKVFGESLAKVWKEI